MNPLAHWPYIHWGYAAAGFLLGGLALLVVMGAILDLRRKKPQLCQTCRHYNFKVSAEYAYGECRNCNVLSAQHISLTHVQEIFKSPDPEELMRAISNYARIYYREDYFGCRFYEALS